MSDPKPNYVRVSRPSQPVVSMAMEPTEHGAKPGPTPNFVRLSRTSQPVVVLEKLEPVVLLLEVEGVNGDHVLVRDRLVNLLKALNEYEMAVGGAGVVCDVSGGNGTLTLKLVPNDPAGAKERLTKLGDLIAEAMPERRLTRRLSDAG